MMSLVILGASSFGRTVPMFFRSRTEILHGLGGSFEGSSPPSSLSDHDVGEKRRVVRSLGNPD